MTKLKYAPAFKAVVGAVACGALLLASVAQAVTPGYRELDAENTLVIDTSKGQVVVEMYPQVAPAAVERLRTLARQKFYDGQKFHRVIEGFMAQTGDPQGTGEGGSSLPNVPGEFTFKRDQAFPFYEAAVTRGMVQGYIGVMPVTTQSTDLMAITRDNKVNGWGMFCQGTLGMARAGDKDSGNSQFFLMRASGDMLNTRYTAFGSIITGLDVVRKLKLGEPPKDPDVMKTVRVLADIPVAERPKIEVMDTRSDEFKAQIEKTVKKSGQDFSACDVSVPVKIN
jgi:peptidylprolyl isomerase